MTGGWAYTVLAGLLIAVAPAAATPTTPAPPLAPVSPRPDAPTTDAAERRHEQAEGLEMHREHSERRQHSVRPQPPEHTERLERLEHLEAALATVRQHATAHRRHEILAAVRRDVDHRLGQGAAGLDAGSVTRAGFDRRPFIASSDGRFRLELTGQLQLRWAGSHFGDAATGDRTVAGGEARRVRLKARGHVFDPRFTYQLGGGFRRNGGTLSLTDAFVAWSDGAWQGRVGRWRARAVREESTSAKRLPMIERSLVARTIGRDRGTGIGVAWQGETWRAFAAWQDVEVDLADESMQATARVAWKLQGSWRDLRDETGFPGESRATALGVGVVRAWPEGDDATVLTGDLVTSGDGWSATLAGFAGTPDRRSGRRTDWGLVGRLGVFVTPTVEWSTRLEGGDVGADGLGSDARDPMLVATTGATWYVDGHDLKLAGDVGYAIDGPGPGWSVGGASWRRERGSGQVVVRLQVQLQF